MYIENCFFYSYRFWVHVMFEIDPVIIFSYSMILNVWNRENFQYWSYHLLRFTLTLIKYLYQYYKADSKLKYTRTNNNNSFNDKKTVVDTVCRSTGTNKIWKHISSIKFVFYMVSSKSLSTILLIDAPSKYKNDVHLVEPSFSRDFIHKIILQF